MAPVCVGIKWDLISHCLCFDHCPRVVPSVGLQYKEELEDAAEEAKEAQAAAAENPTDGPSDYMLRNHVCCCTCFTTTCTLHVIQNHVHATCDSEPRARYM